MLLSGCFCAHIALCPAAGVAAVDDFLRGISFYTRVFELVSGDESSSEADATDAADATAAE